MSLTRLVMLDGSVAVSGLIPSAAIPAVLYSISKGANTINSFWEKIQALEPALKDFFESNIDKEPFLEGFGDGLIVISWDHYCIESFQEYMPLRSEGLAYGHNGSHYIENEEPHRYSISKTWHIVDHHFEESRH